VLRTWGSQATHGLENTDVGHVFSKGLISHGYDTDLAQLSRVYNQKHKEREDENQNNDGHKVLGPACNTTRLEHECGMGVLASTPDFLMMSFIFLLRRSVVAEATFILSPTSSSILYTHSESSTTCACGAAAYLFCQSISLCISKLRCPRCATDCPRASRLWSCISICRCTRNRVQRPAMQRHASTLGHSARPANLHAPFAAGGGPALQMAHNHYRARSRPCDPVFGSEGSRRHPAPQARARTTPRAALRHCFQYCCCFH
jgi:hypothetical protein